LREVAAAIVDPVRGLNRLISGDWNRVASTNEQLREPIHGSVAVSEKRVSGNPDTSGPESSTGIEFDAVYGQSSGNVVSRSPFDLIVLSAEVRYGERKICGFANAYALWVGKQSVTREGTRHLLGHFQHYGFMKTELFHMGGTSLTRGLISMFRLGHKFELNTSVQIPNDRDFNKIMTGSVVDHDCDDKFSPLMSQMGSFGAFLAFGALAKDNKAMETAGLAASAMLQTELVVHVGKMISGRLRPGTEEALDSWSSPGGFFKSGQSPSYDSFPSGYTATAFSMATVVAMQHGYHRWVPIMAYAVAAGVGFSRLSGNDHWLSDRRLHERAHLQSLGMTQTRYLRSPADLGGLPVVDSCWDVLGTGEPANIMPVQKANVASIKGDNGIVCASEGYSSLSAPKTEKGRITFRGHSPLRSCPIRSGTRTNFKRIGAYPHCGQCRPRPEPPFPDVGQIPPTGIRVVQS